MWIITIVVNLVSKHLDWKTEKRLVSQHTSSPRSPFTSKMSLRLKSTYFIAFRAADVERVSHDYNKRPATSVGFLSTTKL